MSVSLAGIKNTWPWQSGATHSSIDATQKGVRLTKSFVHWILHAPMETSEAHGWQKVKSPDQVSIPMPIGGFISFLLCSMTIQDMEYFLRVPANHVLIGKIYDFLTGQLHSYRGDSGEGV